jgi:hypothetical protein
MAADGVNPSLGKKRKSGDLRSSIIKAEPSISRSATTESRESSEEYTAAATHTRSGRQTQRPVSLASGAGVSQSPSSKASRAESSNKPTSTPSGGVKTHPKIKRRIYRGKEQFALCEHCLRGHGPPGNVIVFCDACNKCWHQRCHEPQISKQVISNSKAEWFCLDCDRILHGGKKAKKEHTKTNSEPHATDPTVVNKPPVYAGPRVGGRVLRPDDKLAYLNSLSKDSLVSLLLQTADLAPDLPIFETLVPPPQPSTVLQAQFTSTYVTPVAEQPVGVDANSADAVDEGYDGYFDEHAALYPKPGQGIQLPPEREDLPMLLEGKDTKTFSHWVRGMQGKEFCGTGNPLMT